jgi:ribosomal protein S18 acetylase RimI-like enzyme
MTEAPAPSVTIRPAVSADADGIARVFLESAEHHAGLDPDRYHVPPFDAISTRYREGEQHPGDPNTESITLVAEGRGEIVGFVDARLERSPDPMHRDMVFCHVIEIAVSASRRSHGIGEGLLRAVEEWGRRHGATFASLEYHSANTRAGAFYEGRMGYRVAALVAIKHL